MSVCGKILSACWRRGIVFFYFDSFCSHGETSRDQKRKPRFDFIKQSLNLPLFLVRRALQITDCTVPEATYCLVAQEVTFKDFFFFKEKKRHLFPRILATDLASERDAQIFALRKLPIPHHKFMFIFNTYIWNNEVQYWESKYYFKQSESGGFIRSSWNHCLSHGHNMILDLGGASQTNATPSNQLKFPQRWVP